MEFAPPVSAAARPEVAVAQKKKYRPWRNLWEWTSTPFGFCRRYSVLYQHLRIGRQWFVFVELLVSALCGVLEAVRTTKGCSVIAGPAMCLGFCYFVLLFLARPFVAPIDNLCFGCGAAVLTVAPALQLIFHETGASWAETLATTLVVAYAIVIPTVRCVALVFVSHQIIIQSAQNVWSSLYHSSQENKHPTDGLNDAEPTKPLLSDKALNADEKEELHLLLRRYEAPAVDLPQLIQTAQAAPLEPSPLEPSTQNPVESAVQEKPSESLPHELLNQPPPPHVEPPKQPLVQDNYSSSCSCCSCSCTAFSAASVKPYVPPAGLCQPPPQEKAALVVCNSVHSTSSMEDSTTQIDTALTTPGAAPAPAVAPAPAATCDFSALL